MEVFHFPFLNQEGDYFTNFHPPFPETEENKNCPKLGNQTQFPQFLNLEGESINQVSPSSFLNQEDYFTDFQPLFLETEENRKLPKLESAPQFPQFLNLEEELEYNSNTIMSNYSEFEGNYQEPGPGSDPENSPGSTSSFPFQSLAGSSGHIHFQEPGSYHTEPEQIRAKRPLEETEPVPVQTGQHRRLWVKDRSNAWWEAVNQPDFPESEFVKSFRMSRATFEFICYELDAAVMKKDTMLRQAIPVRQRVAVCIYRLATGEPLRMVSKKFGLGISTCHKLVLEVCSAIKNVLMPKYLQWPGADKIPKIKKDFNDLSGLPNVIGALYTTHIPIMAPKVRVAAYFNKKHTERHQKTSYSMTVQGVVGPDGTFTDVCIGWPGSMPDEKILEKSALYQRAVKGGLRDGWIIGNSGYPLMDWLLTPYVHKNHTWAQHGFNEKVETAQKIAKNAFGRLKGRWSCLQKRTEAKLQDLPVVLGACCVLHNICEMRGEAADGEMAYEVFDDVAVAEGGPSSAGAVHARDQIAYYLLHHSGGL